MSRCGASARKRSSQPFGFQPLTASRMAEGLMMRLYLSPVIPGERLKAARPGIRTPALWLWRRRKLFRHRALGRRFQLEGGSKQRAGVIALRMLEQIHGG